MLSESPTNVTLGMTPSKPEFFSWESEQMQMYVKAGGILLAVLLLLGCVYEVARSVRNKANRNRVIKPGEFQIVLQSQGKNSAQLFTLQVQIT